MVNLFTGYEQNHPLRKPLQQMFSQRLLFQVVVVFSYKHAEKQVFSMFRLALLAVFILSTFNFKLKFLSVYMIIYNPSSLVVIFLVVLNVISHCWVS